LFLLVLFSMYLLFLLDRLKFGKKGIKHANSLILKVLDNVREKQNGLDTIFCESQVPFL